MTEVHEHINAAPLRQPVVVKIPIALWQRI